MQIRFEWNDANAAKHFKKHGVSFEVAARVFADPFALMVQDRIENGEQRWQTIGMVDGHLLLLLAHTVIEVDDTEVIGIISARKADPKERKRYEQENR
jgi:uncharacterized DUF497 family protein